MVSFSLTMGMTPMFRSSLKVFWAFRYWVRYRLLSFSSIESPGSAYVGDVIPRQEDLGNWLSQVCEKAVPQAHESALSYGGQCLGT
jgi:hypothetical protein